MLVMPVAGDRFQRLEEQVAPQDIEVGTQRILQGHPRGRSFRQPPLDVRTPCQRIVHDLGKSPRDEQIRHGTAHGFPVPTPGLRQGHAHLSGQRNPVEPVDAQELLDDVGRPSNVGAVGRYLEVDPLRIAGHHPKLQRREQRREALRRELHPDEPAEIPVSQAHPRRTRHRLLCFGLCSGRGHRAACPLHDEPCDKAQCPVGQRGVHATLVPERGIGG